MVFPKIMEERYKEIFKKDFDEFERVSKTKIRKTVVPNSLRLNITQLKKRFDEKGIQYKENDFPNCLELTEEKRIRELEEYKKGLIYSQEISSMIPVEALNPKPNESVLDMAAAPGSKTVQAAMKMKNTGMIVAVEKNPIRMKSLLFNLERMGIINTVSIQGDSSKLTLPLKFDKILVDAPCSSEGFIRKRKHALKDWSLKHVKRYYNLQKKMLENGFKHLKEGGTLVYSTCTVSPEENEKTLESIIHNPSAHVEKITLNKFKLRPALREWQGNRFDEGVWNASRIWPQDNNSMSFFVAKIRKEK